MPKHLLLVATVLLVISCNTSHTHNKKEGSNNNEEVQYSNNSENAPGIYNLHLNVSARSKYYYTIKNTTEMAFEVQDKSISNNNESEVGLSYEFEKDSAGNYVLHMHYDKIHIHSKTGDKETELDAANTASTLNPLENMLGILKEANIVAVINQAGKVINVNGYQEMGSKFMERLNTADIQARKAAQAQWDKVIGEGMIKKNVEQLFSIYPDSSVRIGDTWQKKMQQRGEINMNEVSTFKLKDIDDGIALIESEGDLTSDKGESNLMGYSVTSNLQGEQQGEYEVDKKTGMLLKNKVTAKVEGSLQLMGKDIPVTIKTTIKMTGKKIKN